MLKPKRYQSILIFTVPNLTLGSPNKYELEIHFLGTTKNVSEFSSQSHSVCVIFFYQFMIQLCRGHFNRLPQLSRGTIEHNRWSSDLSSRVEQKLAKDFGEIVMPGLPASTTLFNLPMFPLINSAVVWPATPRSIHYHLSYLTFLIIILLLLLPSWQMSLWWEM